MLAREQVGPEQRVGLLGGRARDVVEQFRHRLSACLAGGAADHVGVRVAVLPRSVCLPALRAGGLEVEREELGVREVVTGHARASSSRSSARSLRTARNRCTRTVASLSPSARLTSAVVCSAM